MEVHKFFYFNGNLPFRDVIICKDNEKFVIIAYRKEIFIGVVISFSYFVLLAEADLGLLQHPRWSAL